MTNTNTKNPLLLILPTVQAACNASGAKFGLRRVLGQVVSIEICSHGEEFEIVLDDDIPKHRSFALNGMWMETDAEQIDADLAAIEDAAENEIL